jgi:hypothetical protein
MTALAKDRQSHDETENPSDGIVKLGERLNFLNPFNRKGFWHVRGS